MFCTSGAVAELIDRTPVDRVSKVILGRTVKVGDGECLIHMQGPLGGHAGMISDCFTTTKLDFSFFACGLQLAVLKVRSTPIASPVYVSFLS